MARCMVLVVLVSYLFISAVSALSLAYPAIALCTKPSSPHPSFNCSFRPSKVALFEPCGSGQAVNLSVVGDQTLLPCALYNYDNAIYGSDSYSLAMFSPRGANLTTLAFLFYSLPADWNSSSIVVDFLDAITIFETDVSLLKVTGRDTENGRYSVMVEHVLLAGPQQQVWLTIDPLYFEKIRANLQNYYWELLFDPATWLLCLCAVVTIWYGSYRSQSFYNQYRESLQLDTNNVVHLRTAIILPITGSLMLLALFFFLDKIWVLLVILLSFSATMSFGYVIWPFVEPLAPLIRLPASVSILPRWLDPIPGAFFLVAPLSLGMIAIWLVTKFWLLTDVVELLIICLVLALSIGVMGLSYLRLPDLRVSALVLILFFLYDIFWVFISPLFFGGESVMVSVAVQMPTLPIIILMPRFFSGSFNLLGMGDIILPGLFLCLLYRFDCSLGRPYHASLSEQFTGYFRVGMVGYLAGFLTTFIALVTMEMAQPALLYLVPFTLIPVTWYAYSRGELRALWLGTPSRAASVQLEEAPADQEALVSAAAPEPQSEPPAPAAEGAGTL